jgi:hypothetical protein
MVTGTQFLAVEGSAGHECVFLMEEGGTRRGSSPVSYQEDINPPSPAVISTEPLRSSIIIFTFSNFHSSAWERSERHKIIQL